ncbi:Larval cuticle protein LCP-17 [Amphibalanus amphitrite]|uniref:Larval cuticle protein LCP-17 n=1 Tax=Amphibalanus amphitrite TaxID=1232801 RepID=A0A6A4W7B9_AMPAM|nr:larval cuticle protein LCP-17-like [Amphibalanus amphitrite]KAF0297771.1 Larval cuticle protein LCP-17 [Amphibalanus amphitrite]
MKLLLLAALVSVAAATPQYVRGSDVNARTIKNEFEQAIDNSYRSEVETDNGIVIQAQGESLPGPEPETGSMSMSGTYEYTAPNGQRIRVDWVADENGYRATSDVIPQQ